VPNVKIYVEEQVFADRRDALTATLKPIRDMLCADLKVDIAACQFAVLPVMAMPDLPLVNVEMFILPRPERTREAVLAVCQSLRELLQTATGVHVAIRVSHLDPATYIALK
jgi:hypothetical protein